MLAKYRAWSIEYRARRASRTRGGLYIVNNNAFIDL